ncbi:MAG: hypothetical protein AB1657_04270 [Candidatus Micrarchaeota archaeon]
MQDTKTPKTRGLNRKGQVFTIDALLSVTVLLLFISALVGFSVSGRFVRSSMHDEKLAEDVLVVLDENGLLTRNATYLNATLYNILDGTRHYGVETSDYEYHGGSFVLVGNGSAGEVPAEFDEVSVSERSAASYEPGKGPQFANLTIVRLYIWR